MKKNAMPITVWGLTLAQALLITGNILLVSVSALIGQQIAPSPAMVTLPVALQFLGVMLVTIPAANLVQHWGRKRVFLSANSVGIAGAFLAYWALRQESFILFCVATFLLGISIGVGQQYRFAAIENARADQQAKAVSWVMAGGVLAAVLGPNLAIWTKSDVPNQQYLNAFLALAFLYVLAMLLVAFLPLKTVDKQSISGPVRSYRELFREPLLRAAVVSGTIGYAVMILVMTATPMAMMGHGMHFSHSAHVIQWHVLGMFVPSFFTGILITRLGERLVIQTGCLLLVACVLLSQLENTYLNFSAALMVLGVGWNFTFIGATTLLSKTHRPAEKAKVQGVNDFLVFTFAAIASLMSGYWQNLFGWKMLNLLVLPLILLAMYWVHQGHQSKRVAQLLKSTP